MSVVYGCRRKPLGQIFIFAVLRAGLKRNRRFRMNSGFSRIESVAGCGNVMSRVGSKHAYLYARFILCLLVLYMIRHCGFHRCSNVSLFIVSLYVGEIPVTDYLFEFTFRFSMRRQTALEKI